VQVSSESADPVAAQPLVLSVQPNPTVDLQVSARTPVTAGGEVQYTVQLRNSGTSAATHVFVSVSLPPGFLYAATREVSGNSLRESTTNPLDNSLLPSWGTWTIPPVQPDGSNGLLKVVFTAKVTSDEPPGSYPVSASVTYNDLPANTVANQAAVNVLRK
jgi:uncharacterized repeat protein (TIGR01451 family)